MRTAALLFLALLAGSASMLPCAAFAQVAQNPFDGSWIGRISCPSNTEESGAKGYSYDFPTSVENSLLSGAHGEEGSAGSLKIEGHISPDGNAELRAHGRTANPDFAVSKPSSGTPYTYRIKAQFERGGGTGTRLDARVCNFTFTRQ
jgi:hypothetical protein